MLDTFTLFSIIVVTTLVSACLVALYGRRTPEASGVYSWVGGSLLLDLYFFLLITRAWLPPFVSVALANGCVVGGLALMHRSACQITGRTWPLAWHAAGIALTIGLIAAFLTGDDGFRTRVALTSIISAAQSGVIAFTFSRPDATRGVEEQRARRMATVVFVAIAIVQVARAVVVAPVAVAIDTTLVSRNMISYWSAAWFLLFSLALPFLITYVNEARVQYDLRRAATELQSALTEVRTLRGLIPICASCHRIREENQQWLTVEQYLAAHTALVLTQGVCPECERKGIAASGARG